MKSIAIDGPAGAGKSTIAKLVAKKLGFIYVDTGALYRAIALFVSEKGVEPTDNQAVSGLLSDVLIKLGYVDDVLHVYLNEKDVTDLIRKEEIGNIASKTSSQKKVRDKLLSIQRDIAENENVVMDGRDIGTVVLPDASLKIFLTASVETRAKRRFDELVSKGQSPDLEKIKQDIIIRDKQDTQREIAPLKQAEDAHLVDSSNMTVDEVVDRICTLYGKI